MAENYDEFEELPAIFPISGLTKQGLATLLDATAELLDKTPEFLLYDESDMEEEAYYGFDDGRKKPLKLVVMTMRHGCFLVKNS